MGADPGQLLVSLSNMGFNYVLIGLLDLGVAGSAYGTAMAQALALCIILAFRVFGDTGLRPSALWHHSPVSGWGRILALGAPQSLNFIGLALGSGAIIAALQWVEAPDYDATVSAYGIVTRLITFAFLPLLGLAHAMQTITGNNYGAGAFRRSDASLRTAVLAAFGYGLTLQAGMTLFAAPIGSAFVSDPIVIAEVARILPVISAGFFAAGPLMIIAMHFQAIGDAGRAAILGLSKPYLFAMPLTFALAGSVGEPGIWLAAPAAEGLLLGLTAMVLALLARQRSLRWGLFMKTEEVPA
ncbi:MATE family efflux transporter [Afifella pfennigii]|uniref:MATE family efflux transporter n=1 Tax=Afifella pfennigii TaxID=209897 RepID=UPI00068D497A|nr:MATE family efflux transporter [Afifella pfennigii]